MSDLDYKVFGRDSVFLAEDLMIESLRREQDGAQMHGFFSKLKKLRKKVKRKIKRVRKKVHKVVRKAHFVPEKWNTKARKIEKKNRKGIKKLGAAVAVAAATYFTGGAALAFVKGIGGSAIAKAAVAPAISAVVKNKMAKKSRKHQVQLARIAEQSTQQQLYANPVFQRTIEETAQEVVAQKYGNSRTVKLLATEGVYEVENQAKKSTDISKMILPASAALAVIALIM